LTLLDFAARRKFSHHRGDAQLDPGSVDFGDPLIQLRLGIFDILFRLTSGGFLVVDALYGVVLSKLDLLIPDITGKT
jgi:hypothetical protein